MKKWKKNPELEEVYYIPIAKLIPLDDPDFARKEEFQPREKPFHHPQFPEKFHPP